MQSEDEEYLTDTYPSDLSMPSSDEDDEEYDFDYEDSEDENEEYDEIDVRLENLFYHNKSLFQDDPDNIEKALEGLKNILTLEKEKGIWGFKALKQIIKIQFSLGRVQELMDSYKILLTYTKSAVTPNESEKAITNLLEYVSNCNDTNLLQKFYETTLETLKEAKNERLWIKTKLKLGNLWYNRDEFGKLKRLIKELHKACQNSDGEEDMRKGTQLVEIYALEIQMYTATKNTNSLRNIYHKCLKVKSAIPHPRIWGIIRECGGKMHMTEKEWESAKDEFFNAFKSYDEAGSPRRIQCLKYMVIANLLTNSGINPFSDHATAAHKNDPQITALTDLVSAYEQLDIFKFEDILENNRETIMGDPYIRQYIESLMKRIRTTVLTKLLLPYTEVSILFISKELNIPSKDVESLLVSLILDNEINGRIDQVNQILKLHTPLDETANSKYEAINRWSNQVNNLNSTVMLRLPR